MKYLVITKNSTSITSQQSSQIILHIQVIMLENTYQLQIKYISFDTVKL